MFNPYSDVAYLSVVDCRRVVYLRVHGLRRISDWTDVDAYAVLAYDLVLATPGGW